MHFKCTFAKYESRGMTDTDCSFEPYLRVVRYTQVFMLQPRSSRSYVHIGQLCTSLFTFSAKVQGHTGSSVSYRWSPMQKTPGHNVLIARLCTHTSSQTSCFFLLLVCHKHFQLLTPPFFSPHRLSVPHCLESHNALRRLQWIFTAQLWLGSMTHGSPVRKGSQQR